MTDINPRACQVTRATAQQVMVMMVTSSYSCLTSDLQNQAAGVEVVATRTVTGLQERLGGQVGIVDLYSGANVFICTYC